MISENMKEFIPFFLETARTRIKALNDALLKLEKDRENAELIESVFENAHSLKGEAAMMPYPSMAFLMHVIEDVFYEIKQKKLFLKPNVATQLFSALDRVKDSLAEIEGGGDEIDTTEMIEKLKKLTGVETVGGGKSKRTPGDNSINGQLAEKKNKIISKNIVTSSTAEKVNSINVKTKVLDNMLNSVEELLVNKLRLDLLLEEGKFIDIKSVTKNWGRLLSELRFEVMKARLVPLNLIFERFPRMVRDFGQREKKEIKLEIIGGETPLDRSIIDHISEPLIHILRNAIDHGIESPVKRESLGKSKTGTIKITAESQRSYVIVKVFDDGAGIDRKAILKKAISDKKLLPDQAKKLTPSEIDALIFSGITTSEKVTEIAGRGIGMQAVKRGIESGGGTIEVKSEPGRFTEFTIRLPLTLAIIKALLIEAAGETYAIPASVIDISMSVASKDIKHDGLIKYYSLGNKKIPLVYINQLMGADINKKDKVFIVVVSLGNARVGLVVDSLVREIEIIVKKLPPVLASLHLFSGVTLLGTGMPCLILDIPAIMDSNGAKSYKP